MLFDVRSALDFAPLDDLHCVELLIVRVPALLDLSVGANTQCLEHDVVLVLRLDISI